MKNRRKRTIFGGLFFILLGLGLGYAFLTTTLHIEGTADVDSNTWNIYWNNVQVTEGSVTASTPVIDSSKTTVTFNVHLSKPGDFYEFTVDAKNDGSIDAMIHVVSKKVNNSDSIPNYLNYVVTYSDDMPIEANQILASGGQETYKVRVEYNTVINTTDLPSTSQNLSLTFGVEYLQKDTTAIPVRSEIYITGDSNTTSQIGYPVDDSVMNDSDTFTTYEEAMSHQPRFFLKHVIGNNIVRKSYVGFNFTDEIYFLQGGGALFDANDNFIKETPYYEANKSILMNAFGEDRCGEYNMDSVKIYQCQDNSSYLYATIYAEARSNGYVYAQGNSFGCSIAGNGESSCGYL